jgi:hypothetical protein
MQHAIVGVDEVGGDKAVTLMSWLCWTKKKQCGSGHVEPEGEQSRREQMLRSE